MTDKEFNTLPGVDTRFVINDMERPMLQFIMNGTSQFHVRSDGTLVIENAKLKVEICEEEK